MYFSFHIADNIGANEHHGGGFLKKERSLIPVLLSMQYV